MENEKEGRFWRWHLGERMRSWGLARKGVGAAEGGLETLGPLGGDWWLKPGKASGQTLLECESLPHYRHFLGLSHSARRWPISSQP